MILARSTRISQPQGQDELDRTNPLLRGSGAGVEFCFLPGSNFDPASRNTWAKNSGSDVIRRFGRAVSLAGAGENAYTQTTNVTNQEKVTLIAVIERDGASPYACVLATSGGNAAFRMEFAGNGSDLALVKGAVVELPPINIPSGVPHVVVTSHNQLTGEYYIVASPLYGGNKLRAAGTNTQSSIPGNGTLTINRNGGANTFNGSVGLLCGFFDFLSESVAHKILDNPWQLFRPVQRRIYFGMRAGGGATAELILAAGNASQLNSGGTGSIELTHELAGSASSQDNAGSAGAMDQALVLVGASSVQANSGSTASLSEVQVSLTGAASAQANAASAGAISQSINLQGGSDIQANTGLVDAIVQAYVLGGASSAQSNLGSTGQIILGDLPEVTEIIGSSRVRVGPAQMASAAPRIGTTTLSTRRPGRMTI